jgi:hypothetical protein
MIVTKRGAGCGGRDGVARRAMLTWTAKSCGPGAPTLVSSFANLSAERRWQESPVTGESTKETVKTIARGMPGDSGVTAVTCLRAFYFCTQGCGRIERPAFPAPSVFEGHRSAKPGRNPRRGMAELYLQLAV